MFCKRYQYKRCKNGVKCATVNGLHPFIDTDGDWREGIPGKKQGVISAKGFAGFLDTLDETNGVLFF